MIKTKQFLAVIVILSVAIAMMVVPGSCQTNQSVVGIIAPPNGATISGSQVEITVGFSSDESHPVGKIKVFLDGASITERNFDMPAARGTTSFKWDTMRTPNGRHQLDIQGFASNGDYLGMATCVVMVLNKPADYVAPKVTITNLKEGEIVSGTKTIIVAASDDSGVDPMVSIFIDDVFKSVSNSQPYTYDWDTTKHENGPHTITAKASDESNNVSATKPLKVIVRNTASVLSSSEPVISVSVANAPEASSSTPTSNASDKTDESANTAAPQTAEKAAATIGTETPAAASNAPLAKTVEPKLAASAKTSKPAKKVEIAKPAAAQATASKQAEAVSSAPKIAKNSASAKPVEIKDPAKAVTQVKLPEMPKAEVKDQTMAASEKTEVAISLPDVHLSYDEVKAADTTAKAANNSKPKEAVKIAEPKKAAKSVSGKSNAVVAQAPTVVEQTASNTGKAKEKVYIVQEGDNISTIAHVFGVSSGSIVALNNIEDPNKLYIGDKLILPEDAKMVRIRSVVEAVGGNVEWNGKAKTVRAICAQSELKVKIGSNKATLNNETVKMERKARIHNGRTIVPKSIMEETLSR